MPSSEISVSQDKSKVDLKKVNDNHNKKQEQIERFICIWREVRCLWDVTSPSYM